MSSDEPTRNFSDPEPKSRFETADLGEPEQGTGFAAALRLTGNKFRQKARQNLYYYDPALWAREVLGFEPWSKQIEIGESLVNFSYTAVKSCHGAGKSAWAAVLVCWFISTRLAAGENVFVITTAPSYSQVHLVLWEEIRRHHARAHLPGYITMGDQWKIEQGGRTVDLVVGRKPADTDANSFQGKHEDNLLIVLDEANGIPETLYTGAVVQLTGDMARQKMLAIGNPDDPNSKFGKDDATDRKRKEDGKVPFWNWIQIRAWDTPNFTGEEVSEKVGKSLLQVSWVDLRREQWGEDDPRWISKIEARFPDLSEDSLFSLNLIEQAKTNEPDPGYDLTSKTLGVDVSRFGGDRTVVVLNDCGKARIIDSWAKKSTIETANRIHMLALEHEATEVRVDAGNMGAGVIDFLAAKMGYSYRVIEMLGQAKSPDNTRWVNARAYWYDNLREQMFTNQMSMAAHKDLEEELSQIRYFFDKFGALQIEAKPDMKKRLGRSPDFADALAYAMADLSGIVPERNEVRAQPLPGELAILETMLKISTPGMWTVSPV